MDRRAVKLMLLIAVAAIFASAWTFASEKKGDALAKEGKYRDAIKEYEAELKKSPDDAGLLEKIAKAYDSLKWYGRSVQYWERFIREKPDKDKDKFARARAAEAYRWIGVQLYENGEGLDTSLSNLEKAIKWNPDYYDANYWTGRILFEQGKFEDSLKYIEKAAKIDPKNKQAEWLLKEARGSIKHGGEAYTLYSQAYGFYEKGDLDKALELYKKSAAANTDFIKPREFIARIYMEQKKYSAAAEEWKAVLAADPTNKRAKWFLKVAGDEMKKQ